MNRRTSQLCTTMTLLVAILLTVQVSAAGEATAQPQRLKNARLDDFDTNYTSFTVIDCSGGPCSASPRVIKVSDSGLKTELKSFKKGDHVTIDINDKDELQSLGVYSVPVGLGNRVLVLVIAALVVFVFATAVTRGHPFQLIIGQDNRYSNSQFQIAIWFLVLISTYLATVYLRTSRAGWDFLGRVNIPKNLLLLTGLSALTFGGAKGITSEKVKAATSAANPDPKPAAPVGGENFWKNLVQNDKGSFDLGDFQMIVVTLLAVVMYLVLISHFLGSIEFRNAVDLPDVDTTILAAFGLGQGAYLTKKAAGDVAKT